MSGPTVGEREQAVVTRLRIGEGTLLRPVLGRVVSMVLTRANWPLDRLEEALLVCDALCARPLAGASAERPTFSLWADNRRAEMCVSNLAAGEADRLLADELPLVGNVLRQLADSVDVERDRGAGTRLTIALSSS